jgi:hypothetical protein
VQTLIVRFRDSTSNRKIEQELMMKRVCCLIVLVGATISIDRPAGAGQIPIVNASFEDPSLFPGQFTDVSPPGWSETAGFAGVFYPTAGEVNYVPDGVQVAYLNNAVGGVSMSQDTGVAAIAGAQYTLSVEVGSRLDGISAGWVVELLAGSTVIGSQTGFLAVGTGNFSQVTVTGTGSATGDLVIAFFAESGQTLFDSVSLSVTDGSVPEPTSLILLGSAGLTGEVVLAIQRNRKRSAAP